MNFEISKDSIQDLIAMYGLEYAVNQINETFLAALETVLVEISEDISGQRKANT